MTYHVMPPQLIHDMTPAFKWRTMKNEVLTVDQMKTSHIFNSMKMIFNHIAEEYNGQPIWFHKKYQGYKERAKHQPKEHAKIVAFFIWHIESRGDLPEKYWDPYNNILRQLLGIKDLNQDIKRLELIKIAIEQT